MIRLIQIEIGQKEIGAVRKVLESGQLRAGQVVEDFEVRFARGVGARFAVAVSSGTAALETAYRAMLLPGDEIIVPDFTFVATGSMALAAGAVPVLADVDPETFTLDPREVERRLTARTRALAPVHLFGYPADLARLSILARRHGLQVIWDAAHAHGARYHGKDVGGFPDAVCYSFYPSKNMTTGEGGMLATSNPQLAKQFRLLRSHGEAGRYHHVRLGFNFRMTEMAAALGRVQLRKLPGFVRRRERNAAFLRRGLAGLPGIHYPPVRRGVATAPNLFTISVDPNLVGLSRQEFQQEMRRRGIETAVHYPRALHQQPIFSGLGADEDLPVSTRLAETVVSLPVHPALGRPDLVRIVRAVREIAGRRGGTA